MVRSQFKRPPGPTGPHRSPHAGVPQVTVQPQQTPAQLAEVRGIGAGSTCGWVIGIPVDMVEDMEDMVDYMVLYDMEDMVENDK